MTEALKSAVFLAIVLAGAVLGSWLGVVAVFSLERL